MVYREERAKYYTHVLEEDVLEKSRQPSWPFKWFIGQ